MKSMNDNLSQLTAVMTQMPAVMTASMDDLKTVLVRVASGPRTSSSGQLPQAQPQQQPPHHKTQTIVSLQTGLSVTPPPLKFLILQLLH